MSRSRSWTTRARSSTSPATRGHPCPSGRRRGWSEINDLEALERELAHGDVAVCMFEPALTNIGIVLPEPGYWEGVRELCDRTGTLLLIDETHTISAGPGGATKAWGLEPDIVTIGKTLGAGIPSAAYGMTEEVQRRIVEATDPDVIDVGGTGGTLAGNALSLAAMRATLGEVMTDEAFEGMIELGERFEDGVREVISSRELPWHVVRLGCRVEYLFRAEAARNGDEAFHGQDAELDPFIHLYLLNRGSPDDAVPQHGADVPGDDRRGRGQAHRGVRAGGRRAPRDGTAVIGRVSFTTIDANDPDRLAAFWGEVLGTEVEETSDEGRFVFLGRSERSHPELPARPGAEVGQEPRASRHPRRGSPGGNGRRARAGRIVGRERADAGRRTVANAERPRRE